MQAARAASGSSLTSILPLRCLQDHIALTPVLLKARTDLSKDGAISAAIFHLWKQLPKQKGMLAMESYSTLLRPLYRRLLQHESCEVRNAQILGGAKVGEFGGHYTCKLTLVVSNGIWTIRRFKLCLLFLQNSCGQGRQVTTSPEMLFPTQLSLTLSEKSEAETFLTSRPNLTMPAPNPGHWSCNPP